MSDHPRRDACNGICEAVREFGQHDDESYVFLARSDGGVHAAVNGRKLDIVAMLVMQMAAHPELKDVFRAAVNAIDFADEDLKKHLENFRRELE